MHRRDSPKLRPPDIYLSEWEEGRGGKTCLIPHQENRRHREQESAECASHVRRENSDREGPTSAMRTDKKEKRIPPILAQAPNPTNGILSWTLLVEIHTLKGNGFQAELLQ